MGDPGRLPASGVFFQACDGIIDLMGHHKLEACRPNLCGGVGVTNKILFIPKFLFFNQRAVFDQKVLFYGNRTLGEVEDFIYRNLLVLKKEIEITSMEGFVRM